MGIGRGLVIDPRIRGNNAKYINHSCTPNCEAILKGNKVFIYSLKDINKGNEITINYALELSAGEDASKYTCRCGSSNCRGSMVFAKKTSTKTRTCKRGT